MIVSEELVKVLARKLFHRYVSDDSIAREVGDLLLGPEKLAQGLADLIANRMLDLGAATEASDYRPELIEIAIRALKGIQSDTGILKADGVFGQRTLHWLLNRPFGHHHRPIESLPKSTSNVEPGVLNALRYFIENDELPLVPTLSPNKTLKILREALESWVDVCNIDVKQTGNRADANVIINVKLLPGQPSSVVAIADIGPPRDRQLELTFDKSETWTPHKLQATAAHEFGHNLGIRHLGQRGQLMNDTLHDSIHSPQQFDIEAAVRIWGSR
jgi:hypothetical protein